MRLRTLFLSTALVATSSTAAWGQDSSEGQSSDGAGLDEIVVTAQFRKENLQKAAVAIDVVGGDELARAGVTSPTQLTTMVPSLQISQGGGGTQALYIRGVGTLTANSYTDPGVAFNVDGIYIGRPTSMRNIFYDIQRVEVLKGPQGTLYGRNATGGAVNVLPNQPKIGSFEGSVGAGYGNYNDLRLDAAINVPLGGMAAVRLAGTINQHDGYLSDGTNDAKSHAIRGQLLVEPSDAISLRISADYAHDGGKGGGSVITGYINPFTSQAVQDPLNRSIGIADPRSSAIFAGQYSFPAGRFGQGIGEKPFTDNTFWGVKGEIGADLGFAKATVLAAYRESDLNSIDFGVGFPVYTDQRDNQASLEARLAGPDRGLFRWLIGAYLYDENIKSNYQFNLYALSSIQQLDTGTTSKAAFARVTLAPTDRLRLVGGVRFTNENKRFDGQSNIFRTICTNPVPPIPACPTAPFIPFATSPSELISKMGLIQVSNGPPPVFIQPTAAGANVIFQRINIPIKDTLETNKTTFRAAIEFDLAKDSMLYASFENGFHAGGFAFAQIASTFRPEEIDAWTIGSKNRFFDGRVQLNVEAFLWKYRDQQVSHFATDLSGALVFLTENAGASTNKGFEVSLKVKPAARTTLTLETQYLDAKYKSFSYNLPFSPTSPPPISGCPITPIGNNLARVNCDGFRALRSPKWSINAGIEQVFTVGKFEVTAVAVTHYQSSNVIGFEMLPGISTQKGYMISNVSLDFGPENGKWTLGAFVNNIEDERPIGQSFFNNQFNTFASSPLPPRTYGVRARVNF